MAHVDYFLKIDGVDGESTDDKHKGEINIESWSWGVTQSTTGAGGGGYVLLYCRHDRKHVVAERMIELEAAVDEFAFELNGLRTWRVDAD